MYQTLSSGLRETGPQEKGKSLRRGEDLEMLSPRHEAGAFWVGRCGLQACYCPESEDAHKPTVKAQSSNNVMWNKALPNDPEQSNLSGILRYDDQQRMLKLP